MRTAIRSLFITVAAAALLLTPAGATGSATLFASHPSIAAQPTYGKYIDDLAIKDGLLYVGYGDYNDNTGPIDVATVDLATGVTGVKGTAPTEEVNTYRTFGGSLVAPWIDPTGCGTCTPVNGGYSTGAGANVHTTQAGHVYDYTELGSSRFLVGATAYKDEAAVWQSDNGGAWRVVQTDGPATNPPGYARYYWAVTLGGKVYVQGEHGAFKMRVWDGRRWRATRADVSGITAASDIEVFKGKAYFRTSVFDGSRVKPSGLNTYPADFYAAGDWLYAVSDAGDLRRTSGDGAWQDMGRVITPSRVLSVAVDGGRVYVGTDVGTVYRDDL